MTWTSSTLASPAPRRCPCHQLCARSAARSLPRRWRGCSRFIDRALAATDCTSRTRGSCFGRTAAEIGLRVPLDLVPRQRKTTVVRRVSPALREGVWTTLPRPGSRAATGRGRHDPRFYVRHGAGTLALNAVMRTKYSMPSSNVVCLTPVVMLLPPIVYVRVFGVITTCAQLGNRTLR